MADIVAKLRHGHHQLLTFLEFDFGRLEIFRQIFVVAMYLHTLIWRRLICRYCTLFTKYVYHMGFLPSYKEFTLEPSVVELLC